jgi:HAD superfamily hydrolase (TIGR01490 family)
LTLNHPSAAAFFDVDGTVAKTNVVEYYADFVRRARAPLRFAALLLKVPYYVVLDKMCRRAFNVAFYRNYSGMEAKPLKAWSANLFETHLRPRLFPDALATIERHKQLGVKIVLVTGSLDFIVEPLAQFLEADAVIAATMAQRDGRLTGTLTHEPLSDDEKARRVREFADAQGIDLNLSYAYGDSIADAPMLECVGHPIAVNPDKKLRQLAEEKGWAVQWWTTVLGSGF